MGQQEPQVQVPDGDARKGAAVFKKKCASCHTTNEGGHTKGGPNLHGIFGRKAGTNEAFQEATSNTEMPNQEGFIGRLASLPLAKLNQGYEGRWYSESNQKSGIVWSEKHLFAYLEEPRKYIPGTKMVVTGIKNEKERANLIEYMRVTCGASASGFGCPFDE